MWMVDRKTNIHNKVYSTYRIKGSLHSEGVIFQEWMFSTVQGQLTYRTQVLRNLNGVDLLGLETLQKEVCANVN